MSDERVTLDDCVRAGFCPSGIRRWCHGHDVDLKSFLAEGMPVDDARALDDPFMNRAIALKESSRGR